jgi:hypothetical protein
MTRISILTLFCMTMAISLIVGCESDRSAEMQAEIDKRVGRAKKQFEETCLNNTLRSAEAMADSLLLTEAKAMVNDSMRSHLPYKPLPPATVAPIDSLKVQPLF